MLTIQARSRTIKRVILICGFRIHRSIQIPAKLRTDQFATANTMSGLLYSANISDGFLFNEAGSLLARYRAAHAAGFQYVECSQVAYQYNLDDLVAVLEETNLKQVLLNSFAGPNAGDLGQVVLDVPDEEFEAGIRRSIQYAKAIGTSNLHILAGKLPAGKSRSDVMRQYLRRLQWACKECLPRHVNVLIEPIGPFVSPDYFLNNYGTAVDVIGELDCRNLKILLDVFHFKQLHPTYDVIKWARTNRKLVGHIQVAQSPARNEPHAKGDIDYARILPQLGDLFPELYIGLEYKPSVPTQQSLADGKSAGNIFDYATP
ncbi:putative hydroxypyruvate isomerase [Paramacrobiotus metropolitanus]|uniref:putative hydroxypyruvate isomerase n=1 Tax=Paramacrobiotus metropolitanus TaxID=2943436 RepID=UPI002445D16D|nr:putative hydroxypyruvate isomerase [Paramacrobiotus metropolitanus]